LDVKLALATYSTRPRGGVVHTLALAEALAARGEDVTVLTLARGGDEGFFRPVDPAVAVEAVPFPDIEGEEVGARILRSIGVMAAAVDPGRFDIVHAQDCISANALPGCVRTVHHIDHFTTPQLAACHERAIVEPVAHVCVSAAVAAELADGWGIRAEVIPNGVDAARFEEAAGDSVRARRARAVWRAWLGPGPVVLAVGGIEPRKGTLDLLEATALVRRSHPGVRLVIAGGETLFDYRDYRAEFDRRRAELAVDVDVLGAVPHETLPMLVAEADVFAFPSTREGFGLAAMEALAAGVPVVARDLPVLREVFGATVTYADEPGAFASGLCRAIEGRTPGRSLRRRAGKALAESHTWSAAADAHLRFYGRVGSRRHCGK
jgi:glycosyltransferase-like protein